MLKTYLKLLVWQPFMCHQNNVMKKSILIILFVFATCAMHAQLFKKEKIIQDANQGRGTTEFKRLRWGYFLGFNKLDFNFNYTEDLEEVLVDQGTGFNVGLIGNLRINNYIDLRLEPGLIISTRTLNFSPNNFIPDEFRERDLSREVKSTYIHIPLLVKFSTKRINNFKPFIVGGVSTAIDLSSNQDNPDDNSNGQFRTIRNPLFYELGFGIDFYLSNFKFTPSIRGIFGIKDEIVRDEDPNSPWTSNIDQLQTRGIFINFTFQ